MDLPRFYFVRSNAKRIGVILWTSESAIGRFADTVDKSWHDRLATIRSCSELKSLFAPYSLSLGGEYQQPLRGIERQLVLEQLAREFLSESPREAKLPERETPSVNLMDDVPLEDTPAGQKSVHVEFTEDTSRYKWIDGDPAPFDLSEEAVRHWVKQHWHGFLRHKWIEHLEGKAFWIELDRNDFALLQREFQDQRPLLDQILNLLKAGHDNLGVLTWALANDIAVDPVRKILEALDINSRRLAFRWDW